MSDRSAVCQSGTHLAQSCLKLRIIIYTLIA